MLQLARQGKVLQSPLLTSASRSSQVRGTESQASSFDPASHFEPARSVSRPFPRRGRRVITNCESAPGQGRRQSLDFPTGTAKDFHHPCFILEAVRCGFECLGLFQRRCGKRRQTGRGDQLGHTSGWSLHKESLPVGGCFLDASQGMKRSREIDVQQVRQSLAGWAGDPRVLGPCLVVKIQCVGMISFLG